MAPARSGKNNIKVPQVQQKLKEQLKERFGAQLEFIDPHAWTEYGLSVRVARDKALEVFKALRDEESFLFDMLIDVTAVDWLDQREQRFEVIYHLLSIKHEQRVCLRIVCSEEDPEVHSVRSLWPAANFLEREVWDMFGIKFSGHGDLRRILMYDEFVGHPLRKDYPVQKKQPRVPLRIPELRNTSVDMKRQQLVAMPTGKRQAGQQGKS